MEVLHDKLAPLPEKSDFMFHHNFYPKPNVHLKDGNIMQDIRQKLLNSPQKYDDTIHKHSSDIGHIPLEEIKIDTDQSLPPVAGNLILYPLNITNL